VETGIWFRVPIDGRNCFGYYYWFAEEELAINSQYYSFAATNDANLFSAHEI
jgi:hypothetical protein